MRIVRNLIVIVLTLVACADAAAQDSLGVREQNLDEVVVSAQTARRRLGNVQIGAEQLQMKELTSTPAFFGERDIMRSVQLIAGVKSESDASSGFQVRGGSATQNAILYDGAPVYSVGHLAGLFSAFNDEALASATLYKGLVPAQYGEAASAVLNIVGRAGDKTGWHGGASVGLLSAKFRVEGPIVDDKVSVLVTGRRSYADVLLKLAPDYKDNTLYFYDVNAKADWQPDARNQVQLSIFASNDKVAVKKLASMQWDNLATSLDWTRHLSADAHLQSSLIFSNYTTNMGISLLGWDEEMKGHIRQGGLRENLNLQPFSGCELDLGAQSMLISVKSAEWQDMTDHQKEQRGAWENNLWANGSLQLTPQWQVQAGLRLTAFSSLGGPYYYEIGDNGNIDWLYKTRSGRIVYTRAQLEPRFSLVFQPREHLSLKAGYSRMAQNLHAVREQNSSAMFDRYTLSSNVIKPQLSNQLSLGAFWMTPSQDYDLSLEAYYRHIDNVPDYRDGVSFGTYIEMERLVLQGQGRSYGAELSVRKNTGRLTGWLAYTLSWSENKIEGINGGRWYTAGNDRRHDVDLVALYQLTSHWTLSGVWVYNTGQAFTAPSGKYELIDNYIYYYAERNGYRAPAYHRLDVSATWTKKLSDGRTTREWTFGIYNLYNRYNPYIINFEDSSLGARTKAVGWSLFGIVPSVSLSLKW